MIALPNSCIFSTNLLVRFPKVWSSTVVTNKKAQILRISRLLLPVGIRMMIAARTMLIAMTCAIVYAVIVAAPVTAPSPTPATLFDQGSVNHEEAVGITHADFAHVRICAGLLVQIACGMRIPQ